MPNSSTEIGIWRAKLGATVSAPSPGDNPARKNGMNRAAAARSFRRCSRTSRALDRGSFSSTHRSSVSMTSTRSQSRSVALSISKIGPGVDPPGTANDTRSLPESADFSLPASLLATFMTSISRSAYSMMFMGIPFAIHGHRAASFHLHPWAPQSRCHRALAHHCAPPSLG